ncbi:MAG: M56 family metallopeptidase, partial [Oscillospiraceae bacterium]|nr:M56 family metallopeptidase [Oscillospiraceae bacterium]
MTLPQMSFAGGLIILAVIVLRALALNRLPKGTFLALWAVAALRLLVPFSIPSPASVYNLARQAQIQETAPAAMVPSPALPAANPAPVLEPVESGTAIGPRPTAGPDSLTAVWLAGTLACGLFFLASYLRCRKEFSTALPVADRAGFRRPVSIRQSGRIRAPLTYGLLRPVILLPKGWEDDPRLDYVLEHELAHIRHLDALWKLALAATACVHWFNPLVWCMFVQANRDMELRCDEAVVRRLGLDSRSGYALALISLAEKKSGLGPFASAFGKNAIEERIIAIMKIKKRSLAAILAAAVLVCCVGVGFATSAASKTDAPSPSAREGFTQKDLDRLAALWVEDCADMTIADYQQKMWTGFDAPEDHAVIERYAQCEPDRSEFDDYFFNVYLPLTGSYWQNRYYAASAECSLGLLEYNYAIRIKDPKQVTIGEYLRLKQTTERFIQERLDSAVSGAAGEAEAVDAINALVNSLEAAPASMMLNGSNDSGYAYVTFDASAGFNSFLQNWSSNESANQWDRLLSPYTAFGLTYEFDDPGRDGNGLTMWFQGREVRGIYDEQEHTWLTEHAGTGFSEGAVELYAVYTDGVLSGLREASPEDQAEFDRLREENAARLPETEESREFPQAMEEDYDALLSLRTVEYTDLPPYASYPYPDARDLALEDFNQRLLDWANAGDSYLVCR